MDEISQSEVGGSSGRRQGAPGVPPSLYSQTFCSALPLPEEALCDVAAAHGLSESSKPCSLKAKSSRVIFLGFFLNCPVPRASVPSSCTWSFGCKQGDMTGSVLDFTRECRQFFLP